MTHITYFSIRFHEPFKCDDTRTAIVSMLIHKTLPSAVKEAGIERLVIRRIDPESSDKSLSAFEYYNQYAEQWRSFSESDLRIPVYFI